MIEILSDEVVYTSDPQRKILLNFSPLDHLILGHWPLGAIYGFNKKIDTARFRNSLQIALSSNPEMGASIKIDDSGRHMIEAGSGIELIVQECDEDMPDGNSISKLSPQNYPLTRLADLTATDLIDRNMPLLGFRITRFRNGCTLGVRTTHSHVDGVALSQFLANLGEIYNGGEAKKAETGRNKIAALGVGDGKRPSAALPLVEIQDPRQLAQSPPEYNTESYACTHIVFSEHQFNESIATIKIDRDTISTADIICALIWKAWALSTTLPARQVSRLYGLFDIRHVRELGLPMSYQGNAVIDRMAELSFDEVMALSVAELAARYRRLVKPLNAAEIATDIAYLSRLQRDLAYGKNGSYIDFVRRFFVDMSNKTGLFVNDLRFLQIDKVNFGVAASWYDSGQDFNGRGYLEVSRRADRSIVFRYHSLLEEADLFIGSLKNLMKIGELHRF